MSDTKGLWRIKFCIVMEEEQYSVSSGFYKKSTSTDNGLFISFCMASLTGTLS